MRAIELFLSVYFVLSINGFAEAPRLRNTPAIPVQPPSPQLPSVIDLEPAGFTGAPLSDTQFEKLVAEVKASQSLSSPLSSLERMQNTRTNLFSRRKEILRAQRAGQDVENQLARNDNDLAELREAFKKMLDDVTVPENTLPIHVKKEWSRLKTRLKQSPEIELDTTTRFLKKAHSQAWKNTKTKRERLMREAVRRFRAHERQFRQTRQALGLPQTADAASKAIWDRLETSISNADIAGITRRINEIKELNQAFQRLENMPRLSCPRDTHN